MKICIFGAGAIGGFLGGKLAASGAEVNLIARGEHLAALREQGLRLIEGNEMRIKVGATDDPAALGPQDVVILAVKSYAIPMIAGDIQPLLGKHTTVLSAVNGIPWWYGAEALASVDPSGKALAKIGMERALGCVLYLASEIEKPGVIRVKENRKIVLGEPDGSNSDRLRQIGTALKQAGFTIEETNNIRMALWLKLWGNAAVNPISALTHATMDVLLKNAATRALIQKTMEEIEVAATAAGIRLPISLEERIKMSEMVGIHKTSMLQDIEAGRKTEIDGIVGAVCEIARRHGASTPLLDALYAMVKQKEAHFIALQQKRAA